MLEKFFATKIPPPLQPIHNAIGFPETYPLERDLSNG